MTAQARILPDGRLHLNHGPIDLIIGAWGQPEAIWAGHARVLRRFPQILDELVSELPALREASDRVFAGPIAAAMGRAVGPFRPAFITPMAAVAGAVADDILSHLAGPGIERAYVNNGGDIAIHLAAGQSLVAAVAAQPGACDRVRLSAEGPARGLATSGWRGRSFSLGIADAVTVLAPTAAMADAAATMIANAVDLPGHPAIARTPADRIKADTDLGNRPVTTAVAALSATDRGRALAAGLAAARAAHARGLITDAALFLQGQVVLLDPLRAAALFFRSGPNIPGVRGQSPRRIGAAGDETPGSHGRRDSVRV